ncbi:MAG: hypothetical protein ABI628_06670 [Chloroflexota bacterium]
MVGTRVRGQAGRAPRKGARSAPTCLVLAIALTLSACTGAGAAGPGGGAVAASNAPTAAAATAAPPAGCGTSKVSANIATMEELAAAFKGAGISNSSRWAQEVEEYRPYPEDPTWAKLHKELGKYNIDPVLFDAILSCLTI